MAKRTASKSTSSVRRESAPVAPDQSRPFTVEVSICLVLIVACFIVFSGVSNHGFVFFDDNEYVLDNPVVKSGLNANSVSWAISSLACANWHPLTWLSHMLDCQLFGVVPGKHLLVNVGFHAANSVLLFLLFRVLTGRIWECFMVAGLFALHPLHVESVAWLAERKDVLSTFFGLLTILTYVFYTRNVKSDGLYFLFIGLFAVGLTAKPMLVTLPFALLLLDYWPLKRFAWPDSPETFKKAVLPLVREKIPLFVLTGISCWITVVAQSGTALRTLTSVPLHLRFANSAVAYVEYLWKTVRPVGLAALYPLPDAYPIWKIAAAFLILVAVTGVCLRCVKSRPYLAVGWFWFLGTLVPVIGIVHVGNQAFADRYTYVPLIGIFVACVWGVSDLTKNKRQVAFAALLVGIVVVGGLALITRRQVEVWKDRETLFRHALAVTKDNFVAQTHLGQALGEIGKFKEAESHFTEAVRVQPDYFLALNGLGVVLMEQGKTEEALTQFLETVRAAPDFPEPRLHLADLLSARRAFSEAVSHYAVYTKLQPTDPKGFNGWGAALFNSGKPEEAVEKYSRAIQLDPDYADAHYNLGSALALLGRTDEALTQFAVVLKLNPGDQAATDKIRMLQASKKQFPFPPK